MRVQRSLPAEGGRQGTAGHPEAVSGPAGSRRGHLDRSRNGADHLPEDRVGQPAGRAPLAAHRHTGAARALPGDERFGGAVRVRCPGSRDLEPRTAPPGGDRARVDHDRDPAAIAAAKIALAGFDPPPILVHGNFADLDRLAREAGIAAADGVLLDLGLSSHQLDDPERGFSFRSAGPLDMRMDTTAPVTAADLVNKLDQRRLAQLISRLGEERWAARIAQFIVRRRPLRTTRDLAEAVEAAIPRGAWPKDIHPATRTFQAIRMEVNDELGSLEQGLKAATSFLTPGGRMAAISFHSLE